MASGTALAAPPVAAAGPAPAAAAIAPVPATSTPAAAVTAVASLGGAGVAAGALPIFQPASLAVPAMGGAPLPAAESFVGAAFLAAGAAPLHPAMIQNAPELAEFALAQFKIKETGRVADILFARERLSPNQVSQLLFETTYWSARAPTRLLYLDADFVHPKEFVTPALLALDAFKGTRRDAEAQLAVGAKAALLTTAKTGVTAATSTLSAASKALSSGNLMSALSSTTPTGSPKGSDQRMTSIVNDVLFAKLVTAFASLLDTAAAEGIWIVVDRVRALAPAAELLLECALAQATATPNVLVIDSYQRLRKMKRPAAPQATPQAAQPAAAPAATPATTPAATSAAAAKPATALAPARTTVVATDAATIRCINDLDRVRASAKAWEPEKLAATATIDNVGGPAFTPTTVIQQWNTRDPFMDSRASHCLAQPVSTPHPSHVSKKKTVDPRVCWAYHYAQTVFSKGTHFMIFDEDDDAPDLRAGHGLRAGTICANGESTNFFDRLKRQIAFAGVSAAPIVLLRNTGGATQTFTSLLRAMFEGKGAEKRGPNELLGQLQILDREQPWAAGFGVPEISMLQDLYVRNREAFLYSIADMDVLTETADCLAAKMDACFRTEPFAAANNPFAQQSSGLFGCLSSMFMTPKAHRVVAPAWPSGPKQMPTPGDSLGLPAVLSLSETNEKKKLSELFSLVDRDKSGAISFEEFKAGAFLLNFLGKTSQELIPSDDELRQWFLEGDTNGNGTMDLDEFVALMLVEMKPKRRERLLQETQGRLEQTLLDKVPPAVPQPQPLQPLELNPSSSLPKPAADQLAKLPLPALAVTSQPPEKKPASSTAEQAAQPAATQPPPATAAQPVPATEAQPAPATADQAAGQAVEMTPDKSLPKK